MSFKKNYIRNFSFIFVYFFFNYSLCLIFLFLIFSSQYFSFAFLLSLLYFFLILISLLIFSPNHVFTSSPEMFENLLLIVLTIHCCFASFIISSYCSRVVLWHSFVFTCVVKLLDVSSFILT